MSRGCCSLSHTRPTSSASACSSSSTSSRKRMTWHDSAIIQRILQTVFSTSQTGPFQVQIVQSRLHQVYLAKVAEGSNVIFKCLPAYDMRTLRHEKNSLENERKALEILRSCSSLPIPQLMKYGSDGGADTVPVLTTKYIPGVTLLEISSHLSSCERNAIDRSMGGFVRALTKVSAKQFGMLHRVSANNGTTSWREAFLTLLEAILRDAEDMLVTIPYDSVRYYVGKHAHVLDEVTEPCLVGMDVCDPSNILIDESTKQINGLVGFSNMLWADPFMNDGIIKGRTAFFEGFGEGSLSVTVKLRLAMYAAYRALIMIVVQHYRVHDSTDEMNARRDLSRALHELAAI